MFRIVCLLIGYAFGCLQTAYIIGKIKGIDIRDYGSKSAGMTNSVRVMGRKAGAVVLLVDAAKALLAYLLCLYLFEGDMFLGGYILPGLYAGLGAVLGHNFPFYMKFKGGKGMACTLGMMLVADWRAALIIYAAGVLTIAVSRFVSLASLLMSALIPVLFWLFGYGPEAAGVGALLTIMAWIRHKDNIKRLLAGEENKFSLKKRTENQ
jgi:glycerol-3-phosphate acyltransferase PlsY